MKTEGFSFISLSKEKVDFFDYCGTVLVPLAELGEHLDMLDPRIDPFMKRIPNFYRAEYMGHGWDLIYISSDENTNVISGRLAGIFSRRRTPAVDPGG